MKRLALIFLALLVAAGPLFAGTLYRIESRESGSEQAELNELTVEGKNLKMHAEADSDVSMIYRGGSDEMIIVDHSDKSYLVLDRKTVEEMAGMMNDAMRQMEAALANVPAEQRAMVEDMMKKQMGDLGGAEARPEPVVSDAGSSDRVDGVSCRWKKVTRDGELDLKVCVGDWDAIANGEELIAAFRGMETFFTSMMDALRSAGGPMAAMTSGLEQSFMSEMMLGDGFPLMTEDYDYGKVVRTSRFLGSETVSVSDGDFEPPSGYRRNELGLGRR